MERRKRAVLRLLSEFSRTGVLLRRICGYALRISRLESTRSNNGRMLNWPAIVRDSSSNDMAALIMVKKHTTYRRSHA